MKYVNETGLQYFYNKIKNKLNKVSEDVECKMTFAIFSQENPVVADYLENVEYDSNDYTVSNITTYTGRSTTYRKDQPSGHVVTLRESGTFGLTDGKRMNQVVANGEVVVCNTTPNESNYWWNNVNGNTKQNGVVRPTGNIRMIKLGDVRNVRDLGGWKCDGGTVKYGKLFRGGALYANTSSLKITITDENIAVCKNLLGIKHELDFRVTSETTGQNGSALGSDVKYTNIRVGAITSNYAMLVDLDGDYVNEIKLILTTIFEAVKNNTPLYFHCSYGADRTGVIAFVLNGLLGVSQSDLDKDYELTSFTLNDSGGYESRPRTKNEYKSLIEYFNTFYGSTMRDRIVNWCVSLGMSLEDINDFRGNMIDGAPQKVQVEESILPTEYEQVGYIDHPSSSTDITANAYCDLGITGRTGLVIKGKTLAYSTGDKYLIGSTDGTNRLLCGATSYVGSATGGVTTGSVTYNVTNAESTFEFSTVVNDSYMYTNIPTQSTPEHTEKITNTSAFNNNTTMALFCRNSKGTYQRPFDGRLYWLTIEENDVEIMSLLPCKRKIDNVIGLYDVIGGTFFTSANSVAFTAGN